MTPEEFTAFTEEGLKDEDLGRLLLLMPEFIPPIVQALGKEEGMKICKKIDLLIGGVALQYLEAAIAKPDQAKEAAAFFRKHLKEKMARVL